MCFKSFNIENNSSSVLCLQKRGSLLIPSEKIGFCKAEGSYTMIYLINRQSILVSKSLRTVEKMIGLPYFIKCHHSYLVNLSLITNFNYSGRFIQINDIEIPVSRRRRTFVASRLLGLKYQL